ncbi:hypothetical protein K1719_041120 [Acacia pycnantha]|nr:hypothetical protein K1719_041120 [Acacia pycnantha]
MNSNAGEGKLLLLRGYTVKGTVRDPNDPRKVDHLLKLDGAKERLHLIKADLLEEGSFDQAVEGCEGCLSYCISLFFDPIDPQTEIIDPAVKGTLNVLKSCAKSPNVKRVVLTSSTAAVIFNGNPLTADTAVDETWFSSPDICRDIKRWYNLGKTLAEEAAWKFAKENGIDLVALNPAFVIGPLLQPLLNESSAIILNLVKGQTYPNYSVGWVNVKDVANAHIQAFEIPSASGRYILVERVAHYSEHVKILHELFPTLQLAEKCADDKPFMPKYQVSKKKAMTLGIEFTPLESHGFPVDNGEGEGRGKREDDEVAMRFAMGTAMWL